jgi:hypothetical protein
MAEMTIDEYLSRFGPDRQKQTVDLVASEVKASKPCLPDEIRVIGANGCLRLRIANAVSTTVAFCHCPVGLYCHNGKIIGKWADFEKILAESIRIGIARRGF